MPGITLVPTNLESCEALANEVLELEAPLIPRLWCHWRKPRWLTRAVGESRQLWPTGTSSSAGPSTSGWNSSGPPSSDSTLGRALVISVPCGNVLGWYPISVYLDLTYLYDVLPKKLSQLIRHHSTCLVLIDVVDQIDQHLDNHEFTLRIYFDLQKAFDTVDRNILLTKLFNYRIRRNIHSSFCDYLSYRKQYVFISGVSSDLDNITCLVPQSSVLGPLLFLLCVNDIGWFIPF